MSKRVLLFFVFGVLASSQVNAKIQKFNAWQVDQRGARGVLAQTALPNAPSGNKRTVFLAFEYDRKCDPIFSFAEFSSHDMGRPLGRSRLHNSKVGTLINGRFYSWHAGVIQYSNGYEVSFGVENSVLLRLLGDLDTLAYVTPSGERIPLSIAGFREAALYALSTCGQKIT